MTARTSIARLTDCEHEIALLRAALGNIASGAACLAGYDINDAAAEARQALAPKVQMVAKEVIEDSDVGLITTVRTFEKVPLDLEDVAKTIESLRIHKRHMPTQPKSAEWLHGHQEGWEQALRYAAKTIRMIGEVP